MFEVGGGGGRDDAGGDDAAAPLPSGEGESESVVAVAAEAVSAARSAGAEDLPVVESRGSWCPDGPPEGSGWWLDRVERPEAGPVSWLGELAPSGLLLTELEQLPADLVEDDWDHVEVVAHWHRMEAYCAARKRLAAAALARRESMAAGLAALRDLNGGLGVASSEPNIAADELSLRLGVGTRAARRLVTSGQALGGVGIPVAEAFVAGQIDAVKADLILDAVTDLPADSAIGVQERVLTRAGHLPSGSVRRELAAACAAVDPADFEERARVAASGRRVCRPRVLPHGMAGLYAELPAYEATQLYRTLDATARSAKNDGDSRTMDQLRADALTLLGESALQTGWIGTPPQADADRTDPRATAGPAGRSAVPVGGGSPRRSSRSRGRRGRRALAPPRPLPTATTAMGPTNDRTPTEAERGLSWRSSADAPCDPAPPGQMRIGTIGGRSAHVRVVVPLHTLMRQPPPAGVQPEPGSGREPSTRGDDRTDRAKDSPESISEHERDGTRASGGGCEPDGSRASTGGYEGDGTDTPAVEPPEQVMAPAHLEGYGPIPDTVARAIAAGSVWQRLVLDPVSNTVRDLGSTRYRPPAAMAELVRAEKPECVVPGCTVAADACDLDHHIPFPLGATATDNLDPLCRRHHVLTTHAGWAGADSPADGDVAATATAGRRPGADLDASERHASRRVRTWTTASGHTYAEGIDGSLHPDRRTPGRAAVSTVAGSPSVTTFSMAPTSGPPPF